jgi:hypothetical protein
MESLPEDIQHLIYKYKHQLEFFTVLDQLTDHVCFECKWCGQGLRFLNRCTCGGAIAFDSEDEYYDSDSYGDSDSDSDYDRYDPDGPLWMYSM